MSEGNEDPDKKPIEGRMPRAINPDSLSGTTLKVYRFLYRQGRIVRTGEIQQALGLISSSVAQYHIKKLLRDGLVEERDSGYVVDRVIFENMIRIGRSVLPLQAAYTTFFGVCLFYLVFVLRTNLLAGYFFGIIAVLIALVIFGYGTIQTVRRSSY